MKHVVAPPHGPAPRIPTKENPMGGFFGKEAAPHGRKGAVGARELSIGAWNYARTNTNHSFTRQTLWQRGKVQK